MADFSRGLSDKGARMPGRTETEARTGEAEATAPAGGGGGKKKKLILIAAPLVLVVAAAAVWFLFLRGGGSSGPKKVVHNPGPVVKIEPITINLAGGHFLKLGIALQPEAGAKELDGSKALDAAIELFSNRPVAELSTNEGRDKLKTELVQRVSEAYEKQVYDVYFTEFVYQ